jgi:hypothetical protein
MGPKHIVAAVALLALAAPPAALGADAAARSDAPTPAAICRELDEAGVLHPDLTRGECVNIFKAVQGGTNPEASSFLAATCSFASVQEFYGAANKGECIVAEHEHAEASG